MGKHPTPWGGIDFENFERELKSKKNLGDIPLNSLRLPTYACTSQNQFERQ